MRADPAVRGPGRLRGGRPVTSPLFRLRGRGSVAPIVLPLLLAALPAAAQEEPAPPDTIPRPVPVDTAVVSIPPEAVAVDTVVGGEARDTVVPDSLLAAPALPLFPAAPGPVEATWAWDREELQRFHGLSLLELLDEVPGLVVTRTGGFGQPAGVAAWAAGGGRTRWFLDGWELRPLGGATLDPQRIEIMDLQSVRVERGLLETRVYLESFRLADRRPYSLLELADGEWDTRVLRAMFVRPVGADNLIHLGYGTEETDGFANDEPYGMTTFLGRFTRRLGADRAISAEYRKTSWDRELEGTGDATLELESVDRTDWLLRARGRVAGGLWLDLMGGRTLREPQGEDSLSLEGEATQLAARAAWALPFGDLSGSVRRFGGGEGFAAEATELAAGVALRPAPWLLARGEARSLSVDGDGGTELSAGVRLEPVRGLALFGEWAAGDRGVRAVHDSLVVRDLIGDVGNPNPARDTLVLAGFRTVTTEGGGLRAGGELTVGSARLGGAWVRLEQDEVLPYGLAFEPRFQAWPAGEANGFEGWASVPLYWPSLRFEGWYARWTETGDRLHLPEDHGFLSVEWHDRFYEGNLEPTARLEAVVRGPATTLDVSEEAAALPPSGFPPLATTERSAIFNFFLQIRVLDVRAFFRVENLLNRRTAFDVQGRPIAGARTLYGVRWFLRN